jgi:hypothetical protein
MRLSSSNNPVTLPDIVEAVLLACTVVFLVIEGSDLKRTFDSFLFFTAMFCLGFVITALVFFIYYQFQGVMFESKVRMMKTGVMYSLIIGIWFIIGADKINRAYSDDGKDVTYQVIDRRIYRTRGKSRRTVYSFYINREGDRKEIEIGRLNWDRYSRADTIILTEHSGLFGVDYYDDMFFK